MKFKKLVEDIEYDRNSKTVDLIYDDLDYTLFGSIDRYTGDYTADDIKIDYTYTKDVASIEEFLQELIYRDFPDVSNEDNDPDGDIAYAYIQDNFEYLIEKYEKEILEEFRDSAEDDARDNYEYEDTYDNEDRIYDEWRDQQLFGD